MKTFLLCLAIFSMTSLAQTPSAPPSRTIKQLLQDGLFEEEANRNLEKAAVAYEALLDGFEQQRQFAATALFRLAEVRAKQGRKEDAIALYQRVITDFRNDPLAKTSREKLAALGGAEPAEGTPGIADKEAAEIARLQDLVKNSPDLLNAPENNITPLGKAANEGWLKAATFLIDHGADLGGRFGTPALQLAVIQGRKAMVELLLGRGADVNGTDKSGDTALVGAIMYSRPEVARVLLDRGANPSAKNVSGQTPLHYACGKGDLELARAVIAKATDVDAVSTQRPANFGEIVGTPLIHAVRNSHLGIVMLLMERGANVKKEAPEGISPLRLAVEMGDAKMVEYLLDHGADVRAPGLLVLSFRWEHEDVSNLLLKRGADVNSPDGQLGRPLHWAIRKSVELTRTLLEAGADPNGTGELDRTALINAIIQFRSSAESAQPARAVIRQPQAPGNLNPRPRVVGPSIPRPGVPISAPATTQSNTAAEAPDPFEICKLLVSKGAKINAQDIGGASALYYAISSDKVPEKVLEWLLEHGADPNLKTKDGYSAFNSAANVDRGLWLLQRVRFPQWIKDGKVAVIGRVYGELEPFTLGPVAEFDVPPSAVKLVAQMVKKLPGDHLHDPLARCELRIYRPIEDGKFRMIARSNVSVHSTPPIDPELPNVQWKDVVVVIRDESTNQVLVPSSSGQRSDIEDKAQKRNVSVEIGDRKESLRLFGNALNWSPLSGTIPNWNLTELVGRVTAAEPRADLGAIKIRRLVDGVQKEWNVDLRPTVPGAAIRELPAWLADGDTLIVPLLKMSDAAALAKRRAGIFRSAPGHIFGDLIFGLTERDDAPRTLGEFITCAYISSPMVIPNPDFTRIKIHRLIGDDGSEETIDVDFIAKANQVDARSEVEDARKLDVPLQPGDIIEIPVLADSRPEEWKGLPGQMQLFLRKSCSRVVKAAQGDAPEESYDLTPFFLEFRDVQSEGESRWDIGGSRTQPFRAMSVVKSLKNLLKVRVHSRGKVTEYTPEAIQSINPFLLPGDKLEIDRF